MSKNLIENKRYTLTRYGAGSGKLGYQLTHRTHHIGQIKYDYIVLTKRDIEQMLKKIKKDE